MQGIDLHILDILSDDFKNILNEFPDLRRELHQEFSEIIKSAIDVEISNSLNDKEGHIRNWQGKYVGSKGGYAAVRAVDTSTGSNSPGAITNYLENGHKIRRPTKQSKYYKPKINKIYVDGRHFYQNTLQKCEADLINTAEKFAEDLAKRMNRG